LCQNCVRYPLKPRSNTVIYGDTARDIVVAEVVDGEGVGAFRCALVRAGGINFQACSFNHSDISPSLESTTCERPTAVLSHARFDFLAFSHHRWIQRVTNGHEPIVV